MAGDLASTSLHAQRALARAADDDLITIASASALGGLAAWTSGDLAAAHHHYTDAARDLARAGHVADTLGCALALADMELAQGRLRQAERTLVNALASAGRDDPGPGPVRGTADMHVALSRVAWERADLAAAARHLKEADDLGEPAGLPQNPYRWRTALAHLRAAEGDTAAAVGLLEEAERVYVGDFSPDVRPVGATRARMLARAGDVAGAAAWARGRGLSPADELTYLHEYEHVTVARILLAEHAATEHPASPARAIALLDRLLAAAEDGGRTGTVIEVLVLRALALARSPVGRQEGLVCLERAARLAEPEGYVTVFAAEGPPMPDLLNALAERYRTWSFVRELRAATRAAPGGRAPTQQALPDPLSIRELDVLRLLCSELDGPAIARELHLSLSTVCSHTQHIYTKLGVVNRRAAVRGLTRSTCSPAPPRDSGGGGISSAGSSQVMTPAHQIRS